MTGESLAQSLENAQRADHNALLEGLDIGEEGRVLLDAVARGRFTSDEAIEQLKRVYGVGGSSCVVDHHRV